MTKQQAIKYIALSLAQKTIAISGSSWILFEKNNTWGKNKIKLVPISICLANGKISREKMFNVFDNFYATEFGIVERDVETFIDNQGDADLQFGDYMFHVNTELLEKLVSNISISDALGIDNQDQDKGAIDYSIGVLLKITKNEFPFYPLETLEYHSKMHLAWQTYYYPSSTESIPVDELKTERSVYASDIEDRILV